MVFTNKRFSIEDLNITINGSPVHKTNSTKFLGVFIDDKLSWKKQISYINNKAYVASSLEALALVVVAWVT